MISSQFAPSRGPVLFVEHANPIVCPKIQNGKRKLLMQEQRVHSRAPQIHYDECKRVCILFGLRVPHVIFHEYLPTSLLTNLSRCWFFEPRRAIE
jgi:hypothetical protein